MCMYVCVYAFLVLVLLLLLVMLDKIENYIIYKLYMSKYRGVFDKLVVYGVIHNLDIILDIYHYIRT